MLHDFELIVRHFPENKDITIIPISDVHLGSKDCKEMKFIDFIKQVESMEDTYLILGGDLINNATRSSVSNVFDETMRPSDQKKMMAEILTPVKDKILCSVTGNHERRSGKDADDDPAYDIMCKMDIEDRHREGMAFLKIQIGDKEANGNNNPTYTLVVTHGAGGGMLTSGAVLRGERFGYSIDGMDALIVGHTHKPFTTSHGKIVIDKHNNNVQVKPFKVLSMTSWINYGGYAAQKMLTPNATGLQKLILCGNRKEMVVAM